jgi:hypothetical protein
LAQAPRVEHTVGVRHLSPVFDIVLVCLGSAGEASHRHPPGRRSRSQHIDQVGPLLTRGDVQSGITPVVPIRHTRATSEQQPDSFDIPVTYGRVQRPVTKFADSVDVSACVDKRGEFIYSTTPGGNVNWIVSLAADLIDVFQRTAEKVRHVVFLVAPQDLTGGEWTIRLRHFSDTRYAVRSCMFLSVSARM